MDNLQLFRIKAIILLRLGRLHQPCSCHNFSGKPHPASQHYTQIRGSPEDVAQHSLSRGRACAKPMGKHRTTSRFTKLCKSQNQRTTASRVSVGTGGRASSSGPRAVRHASHGYNSFKDDTRAWMAARFSDDGSFATSAVRQAALLGSMLASLCWVSTVLQGLTRIFGCRGVQIVPGRPTYPLAPPTGPAAIRVVTLHCPRHRFGVFLRLHLPNNNLL
jgi:hypothetical protein